MWSILPVVTHHCALKRWLQLRTHNGAAWANLIGYFHKCHPITKSLSCAGRQSQWTPKPIKHAEAARCPGTGDEQCLPTLGSLSVFCWLFRAVFYTNVIATARFISRCAFQQCRRTGQALLAYPQVHSSCCCGLARLESTSDWTAKAFHMSLPVMLHIRCIWFVTYIAWYWC